MRPQGSAAVVGAGIGGLAAAIALDRSGWDVTVFERAAELRMLGAGLSIWPNGVRALRTLGLGDLAEAMPPGGGALRRSDGAVLADFSPELIAERYGAPLIGLHRADLHAALLDAAGRGRVRLGSEASGVTDGVLRLADGSSVEADLVVGADGVDSTVRRAVIGDGDPRDSGIVAFRGVAAYADEVPAGEWWGEGSVAGLLPLPGGRVYWYLACRGLPDQAELEKRLDDYASPVAKVVAATAPDQRVVHRLYDRAPVSGWSAGRVTLLGDAAHPMLPFLGQGACAALEDAVALAAALDANPRIEDALAAYELSRRGHTATLIKESASTARVALIGSGLGRRLRNVLLVHAPAWIRLRRLDRIIDRA